MASWMGGVKLTFAAPTRNLAGLAGCFGFGFLPQPGAGPSKAVRAARDLPARAVTRRAAGLHVAAATRRAFAPAPVIGRPAERRPFAPSVSGVALTSLTLCTFLPVRLVSF